MQLYLYRLLKVLPHVRDGTILASDMYVHCSRPYIRLPYFPEFFPWVLLISECANIQMQFESKTRVGTINIPRSYVLLADLTQTNMKSALDHDKLT